MQNNNKLKYQGKLHHPSIKSRWRCTQKKK